MVGIEHNGKVNSMTFRFTVWCTEVVGRGRGHEGKPGRGAQPGVSTKQKRGNRAALVVAGVIAASCYCTSAIGETKASARDAEEAVNWYGQAYRPELIKDSVKACEERCATDGQRCIEVMTQLHELPDKCRELLCACTASCGPSARKPAVCR